MALYVTAVDIPASTAETDFVSSTVTVEEPIITMAEIFLDHGAKDTARAGWYYGDQRFYPHPNGDPARIPGKTGPAVLDYELPGAPNEITLRAWAPSSINVHEAVGIVYTAEAGQSAQAVRITSVEGAQASAQPGTFTQAKD